MSSTLTPQTVVLRLAELSRSLDLVQGELERAEDEAVRARHRYEVSEAKAYLNTDASNAETRKRMALLEVAKEKLDAEIADVTARKLKSRIQVLRDQVHIGQSIGAAKRSEWAATP